MEYYYIYKITCTTGSLKDHYYIGQHKTTNLNDGYKGSGTMIKKYYQKYPNDYVKEILCYCKDENELNEMEGFYVGDLYETDPLCLNLCAGGGQPPILYGENNGFYGKHHTEETKHNHSIFINDYYKTHNGYWKNKHLPKEMCDKISITKKELGHWKGENNPMFGSNRFGEKNPFYGQHHSEETKQKMRKTVTIDDKMFNSYGEAAIYLGISSSCFSGLKHKRCEIYKGHIIKW